LGAGRHQKRCLHIPLNPSKIDALHLLAEAKKGVTIAHIGRAVRKEIAIKTAQDIKP
jgi:hypothetical protein